MQLDALMLWADNPSELNTSHYRVKIPARYLQAAGHNIQACHVVDTPWDKIPKTVLIERIATPNLISRLRVSGAERIIITFDDEYRLIPKSSPSSHYWEMMYKDFLKSLMMADQVIVPSNALLEAYRSKCRSIRLVENFMDGDLWRSDAYRYPGTEEKVVIGWGGTFSHNETWMSSGATRAITEIARLYQDKVEIVIVSNSSHKVLAADGVPHIPLNIVPFHIWPSYVKGFDIGIAPVGTEYDRYRSCLKLVEYGLAGIPWVADNYDPYFGCFSGGIKVRGYSGWVRALSDYIDDAEARKQVGKEGREWARTYLMSRNIALYEEVLGL